MLMYVCHAAITANTNKTAQNQGLAVCAEPKDVVLSISSSPAVKPEHCSSDPAAPVF
jgi:hypothetical protein